MDVHHPEMQVLSRGPCPRVARGSKALSCLDTVSRLDCDIAKVHIGTLHLASIRAAVFNGYTLASGRVGIAVYRNDLSAVFRGQHRIAFASYVKPLVHLLLFFVHRVLTHSESGSDKEELLAFHRKRIGFCLFFLLERIAFQTELLALRGHFLHDLTVVFVQAVLLDDLLQSPGIVAPGRVTSFGYTFRPSFVVIGTEIETFRVAAVLLKEPRMVFIGVSYVIIAAEFLVRLVIRIQAVPAAFRNP